jgi:hypothetical protein
MYHKQREMMHIHELVASPKNMPLPWQGLAAATHSFRSSNGHNRSPNAPIPSLW